MPLAPGTKVKVKNTFPHNADGTPGVPGHKADRLVREKVGVVIEDDDVYDNVVKFDDGDSGFYYDHELEVI